MALVRRGNLIICKEGSNDENLPYAVSSSSVMFVLSGNPWAIQAIKIWSQKANDVPYYILTLGSGTIFNYFIAVDVVYMLEDTLKKLLQGKPGKYEDIMNSQYMK